MTGAAHAELGDVIYVPDSYTGSALGKEGERYHVVVAVLDYNVRTLPRSSTVPSECEVPMEAHEKFDKDGWVWDGPKSIPFYDLKDMKNVGPLATPWRQNVIDFYRANNRTKRHRGKGRRGR